MISLIMFGSLITLFAIGVPIAFSLGLASMGAIWMSGSSPLMLIQKLFSGNDSFPLLSIPLFIMAGGIMGNSGISTRLVELAKGLMGWVPGGLSVVAVLACTFFGAISGSPAATVAAIGGVLIPSMVAAGYSRSFCGALHAASGPLGGMIPPSTALIIYGVSSGESIGALFIATIIPGLLVSLALMIVGGRLAVLKGFGKRQPATKPLTVLFVDAFWALCMPLIILGGIYGGVFTPTEAAAVATVFCLFIGFFIYRELTPKILLKVLIESAISTAAVLLIVDFCTVLSSFLTAERIPQMVAEAFLAVTSNPIIIMIGLNIIMLIIGFFMDLTPAVVILTPIFLPLVITLGIDPIHFGVIMCTNLLIGLTTPPVGIALFMGSRVSQAPIGEVARELWPFLGAMVFVLILLNLFPWLSLCLL